MATADDVRSRPVPMPPSATSAAPRAGMRGAGRSIPGAGIRGAPRARGAGPGTGAPGPVPTATARPPIVPARGGGPPRARGGGDVVPATPPQQIQARCTKCQTLNLFPEASIPRIACYECDTPIDSPLFPKATPALAPRLPQPTPSVSPASQPSIPSQPKPSLNPAPSHSTSNPHITPFPQPASLERNSSALQISGPIKVKHTTAQDLLNSLDPKGSPSLKATPVPTGGKPKKSGISLMKGLAAGLKKGKKPSSDKSSHAESTSPRPSVSSPMNVSKTTEAPASFNENRQLQSSLPVAAQPILAPPPVEDLPVPEVPARRPILPPKDSSLSLSSSAPIPAISKPSQLPVSCSHCGVQNTLPPRVLSIACEGCGRSVDAPPPPADDGIPPLPPARGNVSEVESAQRRLTDAKAQAQRFRQEAERLQQRIKEADAQQEQASRELDEALERQRLAEIAERERLERERLEQERLEKERLEKERLEKERLERERLEQERIAAERQAALELERKENEERAARQRAEEARLAEARAAEAEAQRLAAHATEQQAEEEEDYDESQMMDCSDCAQPNIFPTGCYRIACWNCNTPMSMTPPATQSAASTAAPAVTPASVPAVTPAAADAPQPEHEGDREEEADLDGLPEANCLSCGELNYLPLSAPRVACWQCGSVVEAPTLPDVVAPQPEVREASVGEDEDDELQADCPDCGEPNIFPEGAPRIACWSCEKAIDRPA